MESLALKFRPKSFDDLAGQNAVQVILRQMVQTGKVPHALLFDGTRGTGKTTTARILAAALNCDTPPGPCGHCVSCKSVFDGASLDVLEIDAASNGLVDNIRELRQQVMYRVGGNYRVVILDEAHSMSTAAFNALLKTLEEPPPFTVFILCTTEPRRIPDTVMSRCMPFTFRRLAVADIVGRLTQIAAAEQLDTEPALLQLIAERAAGAMRDAVMSLDQMARVGIRTAEAYTYLMGDLDTGPVLLTAITTGNHATSFAVLRDQLTQTGDTTTIAAGLTTTLADLLVLGAGGTITATGNALSARQGLGARIDAPTVLAAMRLLWDLKTKTRVGDDSGLDLIVALLTDLFATRAPAPLAPASRLNLNQMRNFPR